MQTGNKPTFESHAEATIKRATETFGQRGTEYGDSWAKPSTNMLDAVAKRMGVNIPPHTKRALMLAVLVDVKYNRLVGGYKDDTVLDGINYNAALAEEMRQFEEADKRRQLPTERLAEALEMARTCPKCGVSPCLCSANEPEIERVIDTEKLPFGHSDLDLVIDSSWYYKIRNDTLSKWKRIGTAITPYLTVGLTVRQGCAFMYILGIPKASEPKPSSPHSSAAVLRTCSVCLEPTADLACPRCGGETLSYPRASH